MDRFLNGENIERCRKLMKARSAAKRRKILNLLAEESAKLKLEIQNMRGCHHTVDGDGYCDPETVSILGAAFDDAWRSLQKSGVYFRSRNEVEATREKLARRIIENAKGGEHEQDRLRDDALVDLARSNLSQLKRRSGTGL